MADESKGFLKRWSRRKQQSAEAPADEALPQTSPLDNELAPITDPQADNLPSAPELGSEVPSQSPAEDAEVVLTDEDMPSIETLDGKSDYSPFLSEGVSKELRNLALKKLFFSGNFAFRDGLDDYDDDFTSFEPLGNTVTSDMKYHERRKERERLAKLEEEKQKELAEKEAEDEQDTSEDAQNDDVQADPNEEPGSEQLPAEQSPEPLEESPPGNENLLLVQDDKSQHLADGKLRKKPVQNQTPNNDHLIEPPANDHSELS